MDRCLNVSLRRANRVLNKIYDRHLQECGLTGGQFSLLRVINFRKKTSNRELQNILLTDQTTLTRGLKPLIRDGYLDVSKGDDQRVKLLSLSPTGAALYREASKCWEASQEEVKLRLGAESTEQLLAITDIVSELNS